MGKSAVVKMFLPMVEPMTISMIYLVNHLFGNVSLVKPETSNNLNSEIYVILRKYRGIDNTTLDFLYNVLDDPKNKSQEFVIRNSNRWFLEFILYTSKKFNR